jgi:hypothetical protein
MNPIQTGHISLFADRIRLFGDLMISAANAPELFHGYTQYLSMTMASEQIASNADFAVWARRVRSDEKRNELRYRSRLLKIEDA